MSETPAIASLFGRLRAGDLRALSRAITVVENCGPGAKELLAACTPHADAALRIGITGPPGAGKSTLVDQLVSQIRLTGRSVAVVAVDPSSAVTGGALLGDRIRMQGFAADSGVYIRSMASRGERGGLAAGTLDVCCVLAAAGRDVILIETMGVGQDEIEVASLADLTVLMLVPGMGDGIQGLKAGILEIADIFVVNKCDREGAEQAEAEIREMHQMGGTAAPVVRTVATTGQGVAELVEIIGKVRLQRRRYSDAGNSRKRPSEQPQDAALRLDHLGIAVQSIAKARKFYESLGLHLGAEEVVEAEGVRVAMLQVGESRLELLEAYEDPKWGQQPSAIGRFLARRGEGLHHIALRTPVIEVLFRRAKAAGMRLTSDSLRTGAGGHRYFFIHPASTGGVLLEIVGDRMNKVVGMGRSGPRKATSDESASF